VTLTDLTGQTLSAASSYLSAENLQLTPVPKPDASCKSQPGSPVTQQSLAPGDVPQKSSVELTYCAG
jgi:beta-lactam-binding protein with PASTA domain